MNANAETVDVGGPKRQTDRDQLVSFVSAMVHVRRCVVHAHHKIAFDHPMDPALDDIVYAIECIDKSINALPIEIKRSVNFKEKPA